MAKKKLQSAAATAAIAGFDQPAEKENREEKTARGSHQRELGLGNWNVRPAVIGRLTDSAGHTARHFSFGQNALRQISFFFFYSVDMKITYERTKSVAVTPLTSTNIPPSLPLNLSFVPSLLHSHIVCLPARVVTPPTVDRGGRFCML